MTSNSNLRQQVNMSNIKAVEDAKDELETAIITAQSDIADIKNEANKKIAEAVRAKNAAIKQAQKAIDKAKAQAEFAWEALTITIVCFAAYFVFA